MNGVCVLRWVWFDHQALGNRVNIINLISLQAVVKKYATVQQSPSLGMLKIMCENDT